MVEPIKDRRETGIHTTRISNGNGDHLDFVTVTARKVKVIAGAVASVLVLLGMVFGAVRFGIVAETKQVIEAEAQNENGVIHRVIHDCAEEYIEEFQGVLQDDLDDFDKRLGSLEGEVKTAVVTGERNQEELKMLLQQAIENGGSG